MIRKILIVFILLGSVRPSFTTTSIATEHVCPVCNTKGTFMELYSNERSYYDLHQYINWIYTETHSVNCCMNCHFSLFYTDFDSISPNKVEAIRTYLKGVNFDKKYSNYIQVPLTLKLEIAEKIYRILGRDDEFWCDFYRILGYCYEKENKAKLARKTRFKALLYAHIMLCDKRNRGKEKELYYIIATMNFYTGQEKPALDYLKKAKMYEYKNKSLTEQKCEEMDVYLSKLIREYPKVMKEIISENKPF